MTTWKDDILQRFDHAAHTYEASADPQRCITLKLRDRVLKEPLPEHPRVLEIGCGTGFLTTALLDHLPACSWLATDISPRMLASCTARTDPRVELRLMDGEHPELEERDFDLIVSSMAVQWFENVGTGLRRLHALLRPGGLLAVTTLGSSTFHEWREACISAGGEASNPGYPTKDELQRQLGPGATVLQQAFPAPFEGTLGFLHHLKSIGARTAAPGHPPMSPGTLRNILRKTAGQPFTATYDVLTVLWRRSIQHPGP